jgi:phage terminase small subunit
MVSEAGQDIGPADARILSEYARTVCLIQRLANEIAALPECSVDTPKGMRVHPAVIEVRQQRGLLKALAAELGLSPKSRTSVTPRQNASDAARAADDAYLDSL